jgi:hypothetical protein
MTDDDFHEIWWIYSDVVDAEWAGLRMAHFRKVDGQTVVIIQGEMDHRRIGVRFWHDVAKRERWRKVEQIPIPTAERIRDALTGL